MTSPKDRNTLTLPSRAELRRAFQAGFRSIDEGDSFYSGFSECLASMGYHLDGAIRCTCPDGGAHGHLPECRWVKA